LIHFYKRRTFEASLEPVWNQFENSYKPV